MSRYPNMSYCQCENTLLALQQVLNSMEDEGIDFVKSMGREERRAYQELYHADILEQDLVEEEQA